ncbi:MAG: TVP38/TMEM64 family protein, partial [Christensenellaceae bacterium]
MRTPVTGKRFFGYLALSLLLSAIGVVLAVWSVALWDVPFGAALQIGIPILLSLAWIAFIVLFRLGFETTAKSILTGMILADFAILIFFLYHVTGLSDIAYDEESLKKWISSTGIWAPLVFILFTIAQVILLPVPFTLSIAAGMLCFGTWLCALYSFIGAVVGSLIGFLIGRKLGSKAVAWLVGKETLDTWMKKIRGKDVFLLSAMFILPMFPDDVLTFVSGLSSMSFLYFFGLMIVSRGITVVTTCFFFDIIPFDTWWGLTIWAVL